MIYVRADGNSRIGMGHVMRCIAISKELQKQGEEVTFVLADGAAADMLKQEGFFVHVLGTDYTKMDTEWTALGQILPTDCKVLVDSYFVTEDYLNKLRSYGQIFYIDDMDAFSYPVDCVINGNIYGDDIEYKAPMVLGGCKYAPLREEYAKARANAQPEYILLTTGSSDPYSITKKILQEMINRPVLMAKPIKVVCGRFNQDYEEIKSLEEQYGNIQVLQNVPDMWNLMSKAMVAVTAGGTTLNELNCLGVPAVCFSFVDNQERIVSTYVERGLSYYGGNYLQEGEKMIPYLCNSLEELVTNEVLRQRYRTRVSELVDGLGSKRIAEVIILGKEAKEP